MKEHMSKWNRFIGLILIVLSLDISYIYAGSSLVSMTDQELSEVQGQALMSLAYISPKDVESNSLVNGNVGFYKLGIDATLELNANLNNLQLGCGGVNGTNNCDIDINKLSFGCIANASGTCITLNTSTSNQPQGKDNNNDISNQKMVKNFILNNPFFQFAIKNPESASTREIIGVRIGAEKVEGPLSFGNLTTFSGYLTGKAKLDMQEMGKGRNPADVAVTTDNAFGYTGDRTLGLNNDRACVLIICKEFRDLTVKFDGASRDLPVVVSGNRLTHAQISNLELGRAVNDMVNSLEFVQTQGVIGADLINIIKPLVQGQIKDKLLGQLAQGLGTSTDALNNNSYVLPYNLNNVHQLEVNSNLFGFALSNQPLQYPGYASAAPMGWSMYLENAFTLDISQPTTRLVANIMTGAAAAGNIALLEPTYRNCYGSLKFC